MVGVRIKKHAMQCIKNCKSEITLPPLERTSKIPETNLVDLFYSLTMTDRADNNTKERFIKKAVLQVTD